MWRIIIRRKLFSLFIGRKPTSWPANNYLTKPTNNGLLMRNFVQLCLAAVWLQIIFCSLRKQNLSSPYCDRSCVKNGRSLRSPKIFTEKQTLWSNDKTIIGWGRAIYRDLSVTSRSIICRSLLICLSEIKTPHLFYILQLMSEGKWYSGTYPLGHLYSRVSSIKSLISLRVHKLQWRTLSKHELSHLNRCTALVGIQHTP